ncbi:hypothetical protein DFP94_101493 [Fontibacillus phaseoli]|uniref:Uncharacterized protein n=1 Tax=Fontibacillus phaseoli TaxID=1416533 RepID=A0A369BTG6_9BACL|nr:hypothetical protein [Fontibacillus phaseoli]RCX22904.1 hypothetical protein DFP94_101493 [Fontibacillus phaseoli]
MAKLNVTVPTVEVEIEGVKYRKVDRKAAVGDVLKITDNDDCDYVIDGAFYEVTRVDCCDDPQFIDEDGDEFDGADVEYEVYEKVTESTQKYREVKRKASAGERIKIVELWPIEDRYEVGDEFTVDKVRESDGYVWVDSLGERVIALTEYVVLEPIEESAQPAKPKRLTVGDYAKVVADNASHNYAVGTFVKIVIDDHRHYPYRAEKADGTLGNWLDEKDVECATEAEVAAAQREAKEALKYGDFADGGYAELVNAPESLVRHRGIKNGDFVTVQIADIPGKYALRVDKGEKHGYCDASALRKVTREEYEAAVDPRNQFAKGDKVRLISGGGTLGLFDYETGGIYTVGDPKPGNTSEKVQITGGGQPTAYAKPDQLEKVSAEEVAEIEKWAAIGRKVGEFKRGDIVEAKRSLGSSDWIYGKVEDEPRIQLDGELLMGLRIPSGYYYAVYVKDAKLIVPAEQRFDREEKAAA